MHVHGGVENNHYVSYCDNWYMFMRLPISDFWPEQNRGEYKFDFHRRNIKWMHACNAKGGEGTGEGWESRLQWLCVRHMMPWNINDLFTKRVILQSVPTVQYCILAFLYPHHRFVVDITCIIIAPLLDCLEIRNWTITFLNEIWLNMNKEIA